MEDLESVVKKLVERVTVLEDSVAVLMGQSAGSDVAATPDQILAEYLLGDDDGRI